MRCTVRCRVLQAVVEAQRVAVRLAVGPLSQTPTSMVAPPVLLVFVDMDTCCYTAVLVCPRSETHRKLPSRALSRRSCPSDVRKRQANSHSFPFML